MTLEIRPAFAKPKEKEFFPAVSPLLGFAALSRVLFWTPLPARIFSTFSTSIGTLGYFFVASEDFLNLKQSLILTSFSMPILQSKAVTVSFVSL
jgi:hypothetical protein